MNKTLSKKEHAKPERGGGASALLSERTIQEVKVYKALAILHRLCQRVVQPNARVLQGLRQAKLLVMTGPQRFPVADRPQ